MPSKLATVCHTFWSKARAFTTVFANRNFTCSRFLTAARRLPERRPMVLGTSSILILFRFILIFLKYSAQPKAFA